MKFYSTPTDVLLYKSQSLAQSDQSNDDHLPPDLSVHIPDPPRSHTPLSNSSGNARKRNYGHALQGGTEHIEKLINVKVYLESTEHHGKRSRQANRPSKGTSDASHANNGAIKHPKERPISPHPNQKSKVPIHPSKFIEGSMHDRVSEKPPSLYTREELAMEQYVATQADTHRRDSESSDVCYDAGIEPVKSSGMYRFGKAIANAFKPVVVWQGIHGIWKEKHDGQADLHHSILQDQRAAAEKAYAELKYDGYRGTSGPPKLRHSVDVPSIKHEDGNESQIEPRRDSGIHVDGHRPSAERKADKLIFNDDQSLMPPPLLKDVRSPSPFSDASSNRRSSFHLQRPSFTGLKKVRSHFQLPPAKRNLTSPAPTPSVESVLSETTWNEKVLRKEPSKKDLQKQQKLSKKVSDLEAKLENARRDLWLVKNDIPPVPILPSRKTSKRFVPGALPSLPSERLLNDENRPIHEPRTGENRLDYFDSKPAVTQATTAVIEAALGVRPKEELDAKSKEKYTSVTRKSSFDQPETVMADQPRNSGSKRRRSGGYSTVDTTFKPDSEGDDDGEWQPTKKSSSKVNTGRKQKSQKISKDSSPRANRSNRMSSQNISNDAKQAAVPTTGALPFHPDNVDKAKILAMRSNPASTVEFGKLTDDIINLRKEFPNITNDQLVRYIAALLTDDKKPSTAARSVHKVTTTPVQQSIPNRVTSLSHHDQPPLPILGRPRPVSRDMTSPRKPKSFVSLSSSDACSKMAEEQLPSSHAARVDAVMVSPTKDKDVPPVPIVPKELDGQACKVHTEPKMEKEEYQWDPDVF